MSHSVTIRSSTITSGKSAGVFINTSYLKSYSGFLKMMQLNLGIACVGIIGHHYHDYQDNADHHLFFLLMVTTFMIATFSLFLSCLLSPSSASIISKTIFEVIYQAIGFALLLAASLMLLIKTTNERKSRENDLLIGAATCGLVNAVLYFLSTILALRSYRGM